MHRGITQIQPCGALKARRAMTLVEVLAVVVILGLIAGFYRNWATELMMLSAARSARPSANSPVRGSV